MEYNLCKVCGAGGGRAGNLFTSPDEGYESACNNCRDSLLSGYMVLHAHLNRTGPEVTRMMAAVDIRRNRAESRVLDCAERMLEVGDTVATNRMGYTSSLELATIIEFTKAKVRLVYVNNPGKVPTLKFPQQVCFVRSPN